jgi:hypothetical protein
MEALQKPILRREVATTSYGANQNKDLEIDFDEEKKNCDEALKEINEAINRVKRCLITFRSSVSNPNLLEVDLIRQQCLKEILQMTDCAEAIKFLSTRLSICSKYDEYCTHCDKCLISYKDIEKKANKHYDETMRILIS